jgi:hypothetical protein
LSKNNSVFSNAQFKELIASLKAIESKLDILVNLQKSTTPMPIIGEEQEKILKLCDKKHTIQDIANETNKKEVTVRGTLFDLKKKGLIQQIRVNGKVFFERIR